MLKLTYTENGFRMEHLTQSLEDWVRTRLILALRSATSLMVETTTASFLLPADLPYLEELEIVEDLENMEVVIAQTESDYVEVSLQGTWVTSDPESAEGIFVTAMRAIGEYFLYQLWTDAQNTISVLSD
ncbi:MAG: hypothetical protein GDA44_11910 [Prochloron sp. SP5CPC1]|nr:hypothetical protein [Candidatus Paraprochloron terpiosi SP5CPC1]